MTRIVTRRKAKAVPATEPDYSDIPFMTSTTGWCAPQPGFRCNKGCPYVITLRGQKVRCPCKRGCHPDA